MQIGQFLDLVDRQQRQEDARQSGVIVRQLPLVLSTFQYDAEVPTSDVLYFYHDRVVIAERGPAQSSSCA